MKLTQRPLSILLCLILLIPVFLVGNNLVNAATGVVFYQDVNYTGTASQPIPPGRYTISQLGAYGFTNDWASSVKLNGCFVMMYFDDNFSGTSWTVTSDTPNFLTLTPNANDLVTSIVVLSGTYHPGKYYKILNKKSGRALSCYRGGVGNNTNLILFDYINATDQNWRILDQGNGYCKLMNQRSGTLASCYQGGTANGTKNILYEDVNATDQYWSIQPGSTGYLKLINQRSGRALSCEMGGTANNTMIHLWDYLGGYDDQDWTIVDTGISYSVNVNANTVVNNLTTTLTGVCIEDVNHEIQGGIDSQMIFGDCFNEPAVSGISAMWDAVTKGTATGTRSIDTVNPKKGSQSQRIVFSGGSGEYGVANRALNKMGMNFKAGNAYNGYVYIRSSGSATVYVAMENVSGSSVYAETSFAANNASWTKYNFSLTPNANDTNGRFAIKLKSAGTIWVGYVFLEPGSWGLYNGLHTRKDVADLLVANGIKVIRMGGCMANADGYRWKYFTGPRENRPTTRSWWRDSLINSNTYESNGWGTLDFLSMTEKMGILGIPDVNINETPQDMADFVDYVNGSTSTTWGAQRAADGHPNPFNLKYIQLGNEERVDSAYYNKFQALANTIWAKDPTITLVVGDFSYHDEIWDPFNFTGGPVTTLAAHQSILNLAKLKNATVWFDVHLWTNTALDPNDEAAAIISYNNALASLNASIGANYKVIVFEFNANFHDLNRALGNANAITQFERVSNNFPVLISANGLQVDGQNDDGWDQGLVFMNSSSAWVQPPLLVDKMIANNYQPYAVQATTTMSLGEMSITATKSADGKTLVLQVVNMSNSSKTVPITLSGFTPLQSTLQYTRLTGSLNAVNTASNPNAVVPAEGTWTHNISGGVFTYTFYPNSFTILKLQ